MDNLKMYKQSYKDGIFIVTEGSKIIISKYEPELVMLEDVLCEACEEGILPADIVLNIE